MEKDTTGPRKLISVVTPCYNEEAAVEECYRAVKDIFAKELGRYDYEHIFADNASTDRTLELLKDIAARDPRAKIIVNSRNFGPFRSMFNALLATSGDAAIPFLPADLQDPPDVIPELVRKWEEEYQVVYGIRRKREESRLMAAVRRAYYRTVRRMAEIDIPNDAGEFQLIDRVVVDALRRFDDYYPYLRGMIADCGFTATGVEYTWRARHHGRKKNSIYRLIDQGLNGLISFSNVPLRVCMFAGFIISGLAMLYALVIFIIDLVFFRRFAPPGTATLIVGLFFFSGVQLFFIGVLGEYISAIHSQVRKRPLVIERERINFQR
jgi:glycosyltransferase involved in cell wall biosynthesis